MDYTTPVTALQDHHDDDIREFLRVRDLTALGKLNERRDLGVAVASGGGFLVSTTNVSFIDFIRNRSVLYRMGAQRLPGLQGNAAIPKQTNTAPATWLTVETTQAAEGNQVFAQVALAPR